MSASFSQSFPLQAAGVHEVCGPAAPAFAAIACAQHTRGQFLWVRESWQGEALNPAGLAPFVDPARILLAHAGRQAESLAVAEEALRHGALAMVVIEITRPLDLREGRRLQLAAGAGDTVGLCIIPEGMGSNAARTRWRAAPVFDSERQDSTLMRWEIIKNKAGTLGTWHVRFDPKTRSETHRETNRLHVVSPAGNGPGSEGMPG
ncbi:MAG: hypothetical protein KDJ80_08475 [Nitratireductor sp.]|nr:hypothetical protein [Nitratireductor sp.]